MGKGVDKERVQGDVGGVCEEGGGAAAGIQGVVEWTPHVLRSLCLWLTYLTSTFNSIVNLPL